MIVRSKINILFLYSFARRLIIIIVLPPTHCGGGGGGGGRVTHIFQAYYCYYCNVFCYIILLTARSSKAARYSTKRRGYLFIYLAKAVQVSPEKAIHGR